MAFHLLIATEEKIRQEKFDQDLEVWLNTVTSFDSKKVEATRSAPMRGNSKPATVEGAFQKKIRWLIDTNLLPGNTHTRAWVGSIDCI